MLRHEHRRNSVAALTAGPYVEEITITVDGGYTEYSSIAGGGNDSFANVHVGQVDLA